MPITHRPSEPARPPLAASVPQSTADVPDPKAPRRDPPKREPPRRDPPAKKAPRREPPDGRLPRIDPPAEPNDENDHEGPIGDPEPQRSVIVR